ncbi:MAG: hypothetical protein QOI42_163 [Frankiaceae bacterium]|nr:hypothetical protein [Frankiaceae bacterium]
MSVAMRWEQCCETEGCTRPARHGALCATCFLAASPARRVVELLGDQPAADAAEVPADGYVSDEGRAWLEELWAA